MKKLYATNSMFNNQAFADMLNTHYNNGAYATDEGVVFDTSIFDVKPSEYTLWLMQNIRFMKSQSYVRI